MSAQYEVMKIDGLGWRPISHIEAATLVRSMNRPRWPRGRCGIINMYSWRLRRRASNQDCRETRSHK